MRWHKPMRVQVLSGEWVVFCANCGVTLNEPTDVARACVGAETVEGQP